MDSLSTASPCTGCSSIWTRKFLHSYFFCSIYEVLKQCSRVYKTEAGFELFTSLRRLKTAGTPSIALSISSLKFVSNAYLHKSYTTSKLYLQPRIMDHP